MKSALAAVLLLVVLLGIANLPLAAQHVISAQAGLVNFTEGPVFLNGREAQPARGAFPHMKEQDQLRTTWGRAELLLSPGVFLRVGRESSIRLVSDEITDARFELLSGNVVVEAGAIPKKTAVTLLVGNSAVSILKQGIYRVSAEPAELRVFDGKARVVSGGPPVELGKGRSLSLTADSVVAKFDRKRQDPLDQWSSSRAQYLSFVNLSTARSLMRSSPDRCNGWCFNTYYGLITYVPMSGYYLSPYGYYFYSTRALYNFEMRPAYSGSMGGGGASSMGSARSAPSAGVSIPSGSGMGSGEARSAPAAVAHPSGTGR